MKLSYINRNSRGFVITIPYKSEKYSRCLVVAKQHKVLEKEAQDVTVESVGITSRVSPNPLSVVSPVVVVSSESMVSSPAALDKELSITSTQRLL